MDCHLKGPAPSPGTGRQLTRALDRKWGPDHPSLSRHISPGPDPEFGQMRTSPCMPTSLTPASHPGNFFSGRPECFLLTPAVLTCWCFLLSYLSACSQGQEYCLTGKNEFQSSWALRLLGFEGAFYDNDNKQPTSAEHSTTHKAFFYKFVSLRPPKQPLRGAPFRGENLQTRHPVTCP